MNQPPARDPVARADEHHIHPFSVLSADGRLPPEIMVSGAGPYVVAADGRRFLDGNGGGLSAVTLGYGLREIADAAADQMGTLQFYSHFGGFTAPPAARLAAELSRIAPEGLNRVQFGTSGSIANETAIRLARFYFDRLGSGEKKGVIAFDRAYHGSTQLTAALSGIEEFRMSFDPRVEHVHRIPAPDAYRRPEGMTEAEFADHSVGLLVGAIESVGPENIACMIAEPILGVGGVIVAPRGYFARAQRVCSEYGILFIADEIVTGFGRLGSFFASQDVFEAIPDVLTSAKGLTSGYAPLSATLVSDEVWDVLSASAEPEPVFSHGFTYSGHPVSCAVALKVIEIMERDDVCGHVRRLSPYLAERLAGLADIPIVGDVRGRGFYHGVELVADRDTRRIFPAEARVGARVARHAQARGLMIRPREHVVTISPPLVLDESQIDFLVDVLRESILATIEELAADGSAG